jgi:hypothetical protein
MAKLSLEWLKGVPPDRKDGYEQVIRNSTIMAERLLALCDEWEADLDRAECKIADYDTPSWSQKQAHRNGDRSRIRKLRDLLSFLHGD